MNEDEPMAQEKHDFGPKWEWVALGLGEGSPVWVRGLRGRRRSEERAALRDSLPVNHFTKRCARYNPGFNHDSALVSRGSWDPLLHPSGFQWQVQPPAQGCCWSFLR